MEREIKTEVEGERELEMVAGGATCGDYTSGIPWRIVLCKTVYGMYRTLL